jgi:PAS domain S-box-containing protein
VRSASRCASVRRALDDELRVASSIVSVRLTPVLVADRVARIVGLVRDIGALKRMEEEMHARAQEFRTLADNAPDLITRYDTEGRILYINRAVEVFGGVPLVHIRGKRSTEIVPDAPSAKAFNDAVLKVVASGEPVTMEISFDTFTPGSPVWHEVRFVPERDLAGRIVSVLGIGRDLTQAKATEALLRGREQQFRTLAENTPDTISRFDRSGRYLYVNPAIEELLGVPPQTYIGKRVGDVTREHGMLKESESGAVLDEAVQRAFREGVRQDLEMEVPSRMGRRVLAFRIVPERDADGTITSVLSISRDVTEIREAEEALKQINATLEARVAARTQELQEANRKLEEFAYTISHDLRTPLRAIDGFVHLLMEQEREHLSDEGRRMLDRISSASVRLGRLIDDILEYSRVGQCALTLQRVDMTALAKDVVAVIKPEYARSQVSIADMPAAQGDPTMLRQVWSNLIGNAFKFSARTAEPRIEIGARREGSEVVYFVADNGIGFDMNYAQKLFGVFERMHAQLDFPGTGVGLAIVKRLVERQGGRVWVQSQPGVGSTFYFTVG